MLISDSERENGPDRAVYIQLWVLFSYLLYLYDFQTPTSRATYLNENDYDDDEYFSAYFGSNSRLIVGTKFQLQLSKNGVFDKIAN